MTSSNGNIFRVTGPLWGESTGHRWIPLTKASDAELWCFLLSTVAQTTDTPVIWDAIALIMTSLWCVSWWTPMSQSLRVKILSTYFSALTDAVAWPSTERHIRMWMSACGVVQVEALRVKLLGVREITRVFMQLGGHNKHRSTLGYHVLS